MGVNALSKLEHTREQVRKNDPPIEVNQIWSIYNGDTCLRRIRILALYPEHPEMRTSLYDKMWIYECMPGGTMGRAGRISLCPEFNLRFVFTLENNSESDI